MRILFRGLGALAPEQAQRNITYALGLGLPDAKTSRAKGPHLAVIGGGPSILAHEEEIRRWEGERWAINGAWRHLRERHIEATFFSIDPGPSVAEMAKGASEAILASVCHQVVFQTLAGGFVRVFTVNDLKNGCVSGCSTATAAPHLAAFMGFHTVTFFGCESSQEDQASHAYLNVPPEMGLIVQTSDQKRHRTAPEWILQAELLATLIRQVKGIYFERSGGLLASLVEDPDWDCVEMSPELERWIGGHNAA